MLASYIFRWRTPPLGLDILSRKPFKRVVRPQFAVISAVALFATACTRPPADLPAVGSERYQQLCSAFYLGLTALQSGEDVNARRGLTRATTIAPGEPAGWADLGLLQFRQQDYEGAFASVHKAQALVPDNSRIEALLGVIESRRGQVPETLVHLKKAVSLDSGNLKALYGLGQETERQNSPASDAAAQKFFEQILEKRPNNLAVLMDVVRLSAKRNDAASLRQAVASLRRTESLWPLTAQQQFATLEQTAQSANVRPAAIQAQFLRNVLVRVPAYRQSLNEVKTPVTSAGEPFLKFLRLPLPTSEPSPSDTSLRFEARPLPGVASDNVAWVGTFVPDEKHDAQVIWADSHALHVGSAVLPFPRAETDLSQETILAADLNYDFKTDLLMATPHGIRLYQQESPEHFTDVSNRMKLPAAILTGAYTGAWAFDVDLDGDLDVVLGTQSGEPLVLRNNGDGSYAAIHPFHGVEGLTRFASADIDGDGDPDVALLDKDGNLKIFANERLGDYRLRSTPAELNGRALQLAAADVNGDGLPDFVVFEADCRVMRVSDRSVEQLAKVKPFAGEPSLAVGDLDNSGALDLLVNDQVLLGDGHSFTTLNTPLPTGFDGFLETSSGRLNVIGLSADQHAIEAVNRGAKQYSWQDVRPRAATTSGDQRINSFGIGGEIEIRSELLTQKQIITSPVLHFGLGEHRKAEFARIVWPNGLIQTEFEPTAKQTLLADQRLKGSCPLLYTWNGCRMQFVKDVAPMSGALGAHDGTGQFARIEQTQEWFKIAGDQLQPHDGTLDLRVTDEYWETYYIDHYGLLAMDHPAGTNVFADERVAVPAAPLKAYVTGDLHPFASARDDQGEDVSAAVRSLDRRYLDTFQRGNYQGVAHDHWIELELPERAPRHGPLYLVGEGWLHPWDDGILVAVNQGNQAKLQDLSLEVPTRDGRWVSVRKNLGVPAGREKTVVLDLTGIFQPGAPRKLRLRTNLEIYWDRLQWGVGLRESTVREQPLALESADLSHRGFSQISQANSRAPEIPNYDHLAATGNKWQAMEGYYTRFGDVRELLAGVDDRYVIAGSGDELRLRFQPATPPPAGWVRDYILIGDGWMKEGDTSFQFSSTVLPLPDHAMKEYRGSVRNLEDDPVYRRHKSDWEQFHTRYIPAESLSSQLWK